MTATECVLTAVIVVLVLLVLRNMLSSRRESRQMVSEVRPAMAVSAVSAQKPVEEPPKKSREQPSRDREIDEKLRENQEWFAACGDSDPAAKQMLDCVCDGEPNLNFAKFDYGAPNMDYKDYVASQAVDDKVIQNHAQFVRDRKGLGPEGEFITGRTYSPDSHDSYDPIPWMGIRGRPQYVAQCNPTQVPDVDTNLYKGNRKFCFWT